MLHFPGWNSPSLALTETSDETLWAVPNEPARVAALLHAAAPLLASEHEQRFASVVLACALAESLPASACASADSLRALVCAWAVS